MKKPAAGNLISLHEPPRVLLAGVGRHGIQRQERYRLPGLWCVHLYTYYGVLTIDGQRFEIRPGRVSFTPPGAQLQYEYEGPSVHLFMHFRAKNGGKSARMIAPMTDWAGDFARLYTAFEQGVAYFAADPRRAEARLWDVLWQMADRSAATPQGAPVPPPQHPGVNRVLRHIELHLAEDLRIPALAELAELSHNHLTRLFRKATGETVKGYICRRRTETAVHLLTHTTQTIKSIALQVGARDLQAFNKQMRAATAMSPRRLRYPRAGR